VAIRITPAKDGSTRMFGIVEQNELAGFLAVVHPQRDKLRHSVEFAGMYVAPQFRRHGFGSALLNAAIAHVESISGVRQIRLGVSATNTAAKALYESVGFVRHGIEPDALYVDGAYYDEERYVLRISRVAEGTLPSCEDPRCR
jgi:ribosomal protein S18 acetylase RimI-like enzyme